VSDTSQGPGWWLASDGRWYPPHPPSTGEQIPQVSDWWLASDGRWYPPQGQAPLPPPMPGSAAGLTPYSPGPYQGAQSPMPLGYVSTPYPPGPGGVYAPLPNRKRKAWPFVVLGVAVVLVVSTVTTVLVLKPAGTHQVTFTYTDFSGNCSSSDFGDGTTVTVTGGNGAQLVAASLDQGTDDTADVTDGSPIDICNFTSKFALPDNQISYSFKVGDQDPVTYSHSELVSIKWTPGIEHDCPDDLKGGC